jgi:hypothetical protein
MSTIVNQNQEIMELQRKVEELEKECSYLSAENNRLKQFSSDKFVSDVAELVRGDVMLAWKDGNAYCRNLILRGVDAMAIKINRERDAIALAKHFNITQEEIEEFEG